MLTKRTETAPSPAIHQCLEASQANSELSSAYLTVSEIPTPVATAECALPTFVPLDAQPAARRSDGNGTASSRWRAGPESLMDPSQPVTVVAQVVHAGPSQRRPAFARPVTGIPAALGGLLWTPYVLIVRDV